MKSLYCFTIFYLITTLCNTYSQSSPTYQEEISFNIDAVFPSMVIIDSERITYKNPYANRDTLSIFPFLEHHEQSSNNLYGDGIEHKNVFGSGILIQKSDNIYYILTNYHVVEEFNKLWVTTFDGHIHPAYFIGGDSKRDIAVISIETTEEYTPISTGEEVQLNIGMPIYVLGSPYGFTFSLSKGIISALNRTDKTVNNLFIQTDASMNPGNSGGALITTDGRLIGISTWIYSPASVSVGINFASSITIALDIVDTILKGDSVEYGWIGITFNSYIPEVLVNMGIYYRFGSIITNIVIDSPAFHNNLQIGDIITQVNTTPIHAFNAIINNTAALVSTVGMDTPLTLRIQRNNKPVTIALTTIKTPDTPITLWPGIEIIPLLDYKKELLGIPSTTYMLQVRSILSNSLATHTTLQKDDIVIGLNGQPINSFQDYISTVNSCMQEKEDLTLEIINIDTTDSRLVVIEWPTQ